MDKQNIFTRVKSGILIGLIFVIAIFVFRPLFYVLMYMVVALMLPEWYNITKTSKFCCIIGQIIIPLFMASTLFISYIDQTGWLLFTYFAIIWSVDVMAMFGGKLIGGPKLVPVLSPKKTISGLVTGVFSAVIIGNILILIPEYELPQFFDTSHSAITINCLTIAVIAQMSDLLISYFKRKFKIKDSGTIIPGHGGVLDRFDSMILTAPVIVVYLISHL